MARAVVTQSGFVVACPSSNSSIWRITVVFGRRNDCCLIVLYLTIAGWPNRALIFIHSGSVVSERLGTQAKARIGCACCRAARNYPAEVGAGGTVGDRRTDILGGFKATVLVEVDPGMKRCGAASAIDYRNVTKAISPA